MNFYQLNEQIEKEKQLVCFFEQLKQHALVEEVNTADIYKALEDIPDTIVPLDYQGIPTATTIHPAWRYEPEKQKSIARISDDYITNQKKYSATTKIARDIQNVVAEMQKKFGKINAKAKALNDGRVQVVFEINGRCYTKTFKTSFESMSWTNAVLHALHDAKTPEEMMQKAGTAPEMQFLRKTSSNG